MKAMNTHHPLESKLEKIIDGYRTFPPGIGPLAFLREKLTPEQATLRMQQGLDRFTKLRVAAAAHADAAEELSLAMPELKALADEALLVARHHFGADAKRMALFGEQKRVRPAPKPKARPARGEEAEVVAVIAEVSETMVEERVEDGERTAKARRPTRGPKGSCRPPRRGVSKGEA